MVRLLLALVGWASLSAADLTPLFSVQGEVSLAPGMPAPPNWKAESRVLLDYGKFIGFVRDDGAFVVENVPSGSYILEVTNIHYIFEPIRVDVNSKGKVRARKLNVLQPNQVSTLAYPLRVQARQPARYFRPREQWRATDVLTNPMVIMLGVAFVLMVVTPKLAANDPELKKELEQTMQVPKVDMPDMADMLANMFGGGGQAKRANPAARQKPPKRR